MYKTTSEHLSETKFKTSKTGRWGLMPLSLVQLQVWCVADVINRVTDVVNCLTDMVKCITDMINEVTDAVNCLTDHVSTYTTTYVNSCYWHG